MNISSSLNVCLDAVDSLWPVGHYGVQQWGQTLYIVVLLKIIANLNQVLECPHSRHRLGGEALIYFEQCICSVRIIGNRVLYITTTAQRSVRQLGALVEVFKRLYRGEGTMKFRLKRQDFVLLQGCCARRC